MTEQVPSRLGSVQAEQAHMISLRELPSHVKIGNMAGELLCRTLAKRARGMVCRFLLFHVDIGHMKGQVAATF